MIDGIETIMVYSTVKTISTVIYLSVFKDYYEKL